ncbi:HPP family protein [Neptunicoccus cionae]|uniref:CBS domain-containing protein n=1 Tax=Neptunicoccus cionae TaxID=2035344 RepID=A0A916QS99_9RHOB|nr:HPP family protein [Amylibacter cionae]GGA09654.1 hypothetical protein GCM10011498_07120 [Amylibacter cionae]
MQIRQYLGHMWRGLGPANSGVPPAEIARASFGAMLGLGLVGGMIPFLDPRLGLFMIAPFGASAVLLFGVPNAPLAQPWAAVVGNTVSAIVGVAVCLSVEDPTLRVGLAVALALVGMMVTRSVHPPGGAVAMTAALNPEVILETGFFFALSPVALGTAVLVLGAMIYAPLTKRHYPFRQFDDSNERGTQDPPAAERLGLSEDDLTAILQQYRQSLNLGVEDLARLIGAAEMQAAGQRSGPMTAEDIMSRDLVTVGPEMRVGKVADLFRKHGFTTLPVIDKNDKYLGVIFQIHLIRRAREDALRLNRRFGATMQRLLTPRRPEAVRARHIMATGLPLVSPETRLGTLLPILGDGGHDAVPVVADGRLVGIVARNDLITALARESLRKN